MSPAILSVVLPFCACLERLAYRMLSSVAWPAGLERKKFRKGLDTVRPNRLDFKRDKGTRPRNKGEEMERLPENYMRDQIDRAAAKLAADQTAAERARYCACGAIGAIVLFKQAGMGTRKLPACGPCAVALLEQGWTTEREEA